MAGGGVQATLEFTPTWVVAGVCVIIVGISLAVERLIHFAGKQLEKRNQKPLFEALQKIKEELMLLGFISLLLTVSQDRITKICVTEDVTKKLLPCKFSTDQPAYPGTNSTARRLLIAAGAGHDNCAARDKVPLLSVSALHHLHIFIFVLAVVHVIFSVVTIIFGGLKIRQWRGWEASVMKENFDPDKVMGPNFTNVQDHSFIKGRFRGVGKNSGAKGWLRAFVKQFKGSVTKSDYLAIRLGFITTHCRGNPKFNFHKYVTRSLEDDFSAVVGVSWYLWIFVVIFLLLNISGLHTYFWIAFIPFLLLLAVGTKLEHIITQLAQDIAEKHVAIEGELVVKPSDDHFWFRRPQIVLSLIHFILFQNAFEIGFFFWIWVQYGFNSCIMGQVRFIIPRLAIGIFIQVLCSYSTLPLYAIVTQMGNNYKKAIFEDHVQAGLVGWHQKVKKKKQMEASAMSPTRLKSPKMGYQLEKFGFKKGTKEASNPTTSEQKLSEYEKKEETK